MSGVARGNKAYRHRGRKVSKTVLEGDLTAATNGLAQTLTFGLVSASAFIVGISYLLTTQFTGGSASSCTMSIGDTVSATHVMAAVDVFGGTAGAYVRGTIATGAALYTAEDTLTLTFTPDAGHQLVNLTAGAITVDVYFLNFDAQVGQT